MKINLASKITLSRIGLSFVLIILMLSNLIVPISPLITGTIFAIAALTDKLDGYIARHKNQVTDFGKITDAIADKILVTPILFLMATSGMIFNSIIASLAIPLIVFIRDEIVNNVKTIASSKGNVVAASNLGKAKTASMMIGMSILIFGLPNYIGEIGNIINILGQLLVVSATGLSVVSGVQYCINNKEYIFDKKLEDKEEKKPKEKQKTKEIHFQENLSKEKEKPGIRPISPTTIDKPKVLTFTRHKKTH